LAALAEKPQVISVRFAEAQETTHKDPIDLVTCEYAPSVGGVADYSAEVASGLVRAGIPVRVWSAGDSVSERASANLSIHRSLGRFGLGRLLKAARQMRRSGGGKTILLQWEPVGFGAKSLNLPFCVWICWQVLRGSRLIVMFHETFLSYGKHTLKRLAAATLQRIMALLLVNSAAKTFASTERGAEAINKFNFLRCRVEHLPVFSNIQPCTDPYYSSVLRKQFAGEGEVLVGHFGRYNAQVEPLATGALAALLHANPDTKILFAGECADKYQRVIQSEHPQLASRVYSAGLSSDQKISTVIGACDFMFQPYPDGLTTRRSTTMAALRNARLVVSNKGSETEALWDTTAAVYMANSTETGEMASEMNLLARNPKRIAEGSRAARKFYERHFSVERTLTTIAACLDRA
jgi:hypothetical protein